MKYSASIHKTKCIHRIILFFASLKLPYIFVTSFQIKDMCQISQQALHSLYFTVKDLVTGVC